MAQSIDTKELIALFDAISAAIDADQPRLSELDGVIGDADHGVTMSLGFSAVTKALAEVDASQPSQVLATAARSFLSAVGASSGPLYATGFLRAAAAAKGLDALDRDAAVAVIGAIATGIEERGKAKPGDKTMVDAWRPAAEAADRAASEGRDLAGCLAASAEAAQAGAEATKAMRALLGRAARLGDRSLGHMDPGAASAALILKTIADSVGRP